MGERDYDFILYQVGSHLSYPWSPVKLCIDVISRSSARGYIGYVSESGIMGHAQPHMRGRKNHLFYFLSLSFLPYNNGIEYIHNADQIEHFIELSIVEKKKKEKKWGWNRNEDGGMR